jgi:poly(A) polymerase
VVSDVSGLVALHLRFHGYSQAGWTDAAVRRYVRDAGPLLTRLHVLTRADCTTRNNATALRLQRAYDDLARRIKALSAQEELDKIRPDLNGTEIMQVLGIPPGPLVGQAKRFLLELRMEHGPLGRDRAARELAALGTGKGPGRAGSAGHSARRGLTASDPGARRRDREPR